MAGRAAGLSTGAWSSATGALVFCRSASAMKSVMRGCFACEGRWKRSVTGRLPRGSDSRRSSPSAGGLDAESRLARAGLGSHVLEPNASASFRSRRASSATSCPSRPARRARASRERHRVPWSSCDLSVMVTLRDARIGLRWSTRVSAETQLLELRNLPADRRSGRAHQLGQRRHGWRGGAACAA